MSADAVAVDRRIFFLACFEHIFINATAGENRDFFKTARVENATNFESMFGQITAIEANAFDFDAITRQLRCEPDDFLCSSFRVVRIDQQNDVLRQRSERSGRKQQFHRHAPE